MTRDHHIPVHSAPSLSALIRVFGKIGLLSFGGPAAQIALLQKESVDAHGWIDEDAFLRGLSFCMMLPGPEAMQLATYIGWRARGVPGGLIAGGLFVLPGACVIAVLSALYLSFGTEPNMQSAFLGIKAAVVAIVLGAVSKLARKALSGRSAIILAVLAFVALYAFQVPFPVVVGCAALWGLARPSGALHAAAGPVSHAHLGRTLLIWGSLWAAPLLALGALGGGLLFDLALFFGQLAITTFGGAYAVLAYMTQTVVQTHGWLTDGQMIDALGLAETTPGPLILVTQFVGHVAGHSQGGWALWLGAGAITLWMTFVPCFLWIFAGAPYLEALTSHPRLGQALKAITAAVVGVMVSLALWFGINVLFATSFTFHLGPAAFLLPSLAHLNIAAVLCLMLACALLWWRGWSVIWTLAACVCLAALLGQLGL